MADASIIISVILACGIPGTLSTLAIKNLNDSIKKKDFDRKQHDVLIINGIKSSIRLGESTALAIKDANDGKTNAETDEALTTARLAREEMDKFICDQAMTRLN